MEKDDFYMTVGLSYVAICSHTCTVQKDFHKDTFIYVPFILPFLLHSTTVLDHNISYMQGLYMLSIIIKALCIARKVS